jgi:acetyl-CoA synthetase
MNLNNPLGQPEDRVLALVSVYADSGACAADLLCDRHDPSSVAYTIVGADLSGVDLTFGMLREESERLAAALAALGAQRGDRIATLMGKSREYLVTVMAIWRLGAVHVPLFTAFARPAIVQRLVLSGCKWVVCDPTQAPKLVSGDDMPSDPAWRVIETGNAARAQVLSYDGLLRGGTRRFGGAAVGGDAPIIQIYTSGTTGEPKGVLVPLRAVAGFQAYAEYGLGLRSEDVLWNAADPGWGYGLFFGILSTLSTGVRGVLFQSGFSVEHTYRVLSRYGVTNFTAAPTVYRSLRASGLAPPEDLKLRCASSAGEPLTPEVNEWATRVLGVPVHDHYGQTEAGMLINNHHHPALRRPLRARSMGRALSGWKAVVLGFDRDEIARTNEEGRVAIDLRESPLAWFEGYVEEPTRSAERFSADGRWYLTGDVGHVDEEGYFYFSARQDDVIIMAGYRIAPPDVESVLVTHPAVAECAVAARPDEIRGEVLVAAVVLRSGQTASPELTLELQTLVKQRYAAHAYPRQIYYLANLPKTPSGKVQRFILRQQLHDQAVPLS